MLATLLGVMYLTDGLPRKGRWAMTIVGTTDNRGNSFAVRKLLTTKFPLVAFLMELAAQCQARELELGLLWAPREQNVEADELSSSIFRHFDPARRVEVDVDAAASSFLVLDWALARGETMFDGLAQSRAAGGGASRRAAAKSGRGLRETDPW